LLIGERGVGCDDPQCSLFRWLKRLFTPAGFIPRRTPFYLIFIQSATSQLQVENQADSSIEMKSKKEPKFTINFSSNNT